MSVLILTNKTQPQNRLSTTEQPWPFNSFQGLLIPCGLYLALDTWVFRQHFNDLKCQRAVWSFIVSQPSGMETAKAGKRAKECFTPTKPWTFKSALVGGDPATPGVCWQPGWGRWARQKINLFSPSSASIQISGWMLIKRILQAQRACKLILQTPECM